MSGLLFGAIAGGMSGAGRAGVAALGELQKHEQNKTLEEMRAELLFQKQARLAEISHGYNVELEDNRQTFASGEANKEREFRSGEAAAGREHETGLLGIRMQDEWARFNISLKDSGLDRASRERVARMQISATKSQLQTDSKGNIFRINMDTGKATQVVDETTGKPLQAKTDLSASQLKIIGVQESWAKEVMGNNMSTEAEKTAATEMLTVTLPRMLSGEGPSPTDAAYEHFFKNSHRAQAIAEWNKVWAQHGIPADMVLAAAATAAEQEKKRKAAAAPAPTPAAGPAPAPGIVEGAKTDDAIFSKLSKISVHKDGRVVYTDETGTPRMVRDPGAFVDKFGVSPYDARFK